MKIIKVQNAIALACIVLIFAFLSLGNATAHKYILCLAQQLSSIAAPPLPSAKATAIAFILQTIKDHATLETAQKSIQQITSGLITAVPLKQGTAQWLATFQNIPLDKAYLEKTYTDLSTTLLTQAQAELTKLIEKAEALRATAQDQYSARKGGTPIFDGIFILANNLLSAGEKYTKLVTEIFGAPFDTDWKTYFSNISQELIVASFALLDHGINHIQRASWAERETEDFYLKSFESLLPKKLAELQNQFNTTAAKPFLQEFEKAINKAFTDWQIYVNDFDYTAKSSAGSTTPQTILWDKNFGTYDTAIHFAKLTPPITFPAGEILITREQALRILGLSENPSPTPEEIRIAWKNSLLLYHPDKAASKAISSKAADNTSKLINAIYGRLINKS